MDLLVATQNAGKKREYRHLLTPLVTAGTRLYFPDDLGINIYVPEDQNTYVSNARQKAEAYLQATGMIALADDSGLEVDALHGAPGAHSARYAPGPDTNRVTVLLSHLRSVPWEERTARFRCLIVVTTPDGTFHQAEGVCEGYIALSPAGKGGFGYDPVFCLPAYGCTMAELSFAEKNRISHRARAVEAALPTLLDLAKQQEKSVSRG